jgi:hypothetical protein
MYMDFSFAGKRLANPAASFFTPQVIQGENVEIGGVYSQSNNPSQAYVQFLIDNGERINSMGSYLSLLNVKYVILAKEVDFYSYSFLFNQTNMKMISNTAHLYLFENMVDSSRIYSVDNINQISSLNDLLALGNVSGGAFKISHIVEMREWNTTYPSYSKLSEDEYKFPNSPSGNIIFVPTNYDPRYWKANKQEGGSSLGFAFVYNKSDPGQDVSIYYSRSGLYFASYAISLPSALIASIFYILKYDKRIKRFFRLNRR